MNQNAYLLVGFTAIVGALVGALTFSMLRFVSAMRSAREDRMGSADHRLAAALQDAVGKLKAQERATAARADATERLSAEIVSSLTSGLLVLGLDRAVRILNPAGRRLLHVADGASVTSAQALLGDSALGALVEECLTTGQAIVRRTAKGPVGPDGALCFGVSVSPLYDEAGQLTGVVSLFTDLTAVQQLEEQLRLKESLAALGELTAGIAHEFRNGLATIDGYSKLIDRVSMPDTQRAYVDGIRAEAVSLGEIVTNFLNFARPAELILTDIDLKSICERAADEMRGEARALGGDILVRGRFGRAQGDEVLLRQAFSNLMRNAVEACAGRSIPPAILVESLDDAVEAGTCIHIDDNGPGIDPSSREKVFTPFFTSKRNGTGLGLALVQKIVVFHNGRVAVSASPAGGARLQVFLPAA